MKRWSPAAVASLLRRTEPVHRHRRIGAAPESASPDRRSNSAAPAGHRPRDLERHRTRSGGLQVVVDDGAIRRILPTGSSTGHGMSVLVFQRTRQAVVGLKRTRRPRRWPCGLASQASKSICRSGVMSSRIQNPRPCVAQTRSSSFTIRSRTEVTPMFNRSDCQLCRHRTTRRRRAQFRQTADPFFLGSSRTALTVSPAGMPLTISVQVLPPSCVRKMCGRRSSSRSVLTAAYAVSGRSARRR